ncbi:MAG TPA: ABC transporter permease [Solirubrobacteraceae bacterium]|jgi:ABC-type spermidine/putrescine transport system permease subunit II
MKRPSLLAIITALVLVFLFAPIVVVVLNAFNGNKTLDSWGGATGRWFSQAFHDPAVRSALWVSVRAALASTGVSLIIAIPAALWTRRAGPRARSLFDATTYMRIVLPEVVAAAGLFLLFRRINFGLGILTIIAGHIVFTSAYATIVLQARVATLTNSLEEAAADLGATPWRAFRRVTLPLLRPAVIVAALLVFTFSMDDVVTSAFLSGDTVTLPVLIFGLMRFHVTPEVNAIAAGVTALTLVTFSLSAALLGVRTGTTMVAGADASVPAT